MNNLFNDKLLSKKANEEVDLSKHNLSERREYLNKWIAMYENGVLDKTKEEQLQGEFISDIFSKLLNAKNITDGEQEWNLERETKTNVDGQKADGTLGFFDKKGKKDIRALIELKGANINLDARQKRVGDTRSAVEQAFGYAPKYGANCQWIIVSNFKEIRLYKSNSMLEYQVFLLKNLRDDLEFKKFIYLLSFYALVGTEKKKAKTLELSEEYQKAQNEIENKFYNKYKQIRLEVYESMKKNNSDVSEIVIIEKVQKLMDRFLFICFCEDKGLIPANSYRKIVLQGEKFGSIFEMFKMFCHWIDTGNKIRDISHFNGGLFKPDSILDNLYIDDEVFEKMQCIADYDFDSDLNEAILGHIFEQSISDIEELKSSINDEEFDKKESKRKKDGIFYTPKYITKYIVENTIGSWIEDKKKEFGEDKLPELEEKDYIRKTHNLKLKYTSNYQKHIEFWEKLQLALKNIKVIDPACGSGAFLIEAFDYLFKYNQFLDEKLFELKGTKDLFTDPIKNILENNIFGVDLNKESVEITKLSLWLRTANKNKTLTTLENNIKCGNSLISDEEIAGESSFDWEKEFPIVFKNGGFDVVVGNPPYVLVQPSNTEKKILDYYKTFEVSSYKIDLFNLFFEKGIKLLKQSGKLGYITPNTYLNNKYTEKLRKFILENCAIQEVINYKNNVFNQANVDVCTLILTKGNKENNTINILEAKNEKIIFIKKQLQKEWGKEENLIFNIRRTFDIDIQNCKRLEKIAFVNFGLQTKSKKEFVSENKIDETWECCYTGKDVSRYHLSNSSLYFKNIPELVKAGGSWNMEYHHSKKIVVRQIGNPEPIFAYDKYGYAILNTMYSIVLFDENFDYNYLLSILNSKLIKKYWISKYSDEKKLFPKIKGFQLKSLPIKNIPLEKQSPFVEKANIMLELNEELQKKIDKFKNRLFSNFELQKTTKKIDAFYELTFKNLLKELKKQKVNLTLSEQDEWEEYFEAYKKDIIELKQEIAETDKIINHMVYELYDLNDEEV